MRPVLDWLGFKPTIESFVARLMRALPREEEKEWSFKKEDGSLRNSAGTTVALGNMFLEYSAAKASSRSDLLEKYTDVIRSISREVPDLWVAAAKNVFPVVRSRYVATQIEIASRGTHASLDPFAATPLAGDLQVCLMYDFGNAMSYISAKRLETWGQSFGDAFKRSLANLGALDEPAWVDSGEGYFQLASPMSYNESMMLLDRVVDALPFKDHAILSPCQRGVLLAADARSRRSIEAMLLEGIRCVQAEAWPISGTLCTRHRGTWVEFVAEGANADLAHELVSRHELGNYEGQKEALDAWHDRIGKDVFVATYDLLRHGSSVQSYAAWSQGVLTLLPVADWVMLTMKNPKDGCTNYKHVAWQDMLHVCGHRLKSTDETPTRCLVDSFPDESEWETLSDASRS